MFASKSRARLAKVAATVAATALLATGCAGVQETGGEQLNLQFNSFLGPTTPQAKAMQWAWAELAERSNGTINVEEFWAGALVNGPDTMSAVAEGRIDLGHMTVLYNPAQLPLSQVIAIPFVTDDVSKVAEIYTELYENNADYKAEWDKQGVVPVMFLGVPAGAVGGKDKIEGPEFFKGKNVRSSGYVAQGLQLLGANPVALQSPEVYEAIQRGTVEAWANNILDTAIGDQSLHEVAPWVADAGLGLYTVNAVLISKTRWESMTDEQRKLVKEIAAEAATMAVNELASFDDAACEKLLSVGGGATKWSDDKVKQWSDLVGTSALDAWKKDVQAAGVDPEGFYADYMAAVEKANAGSTYVNGIARCAEKTAAAGR